MGKNLMGKAMSKIVSRYYWAWIHGATLLKNFSDEQRFYRFVKACRKYSRTRIDGTWLRHHLEKDLPAKIKDPEHLQKLTQKAIYLFDAIMDYEKTEFRR